MTRRWALLLVLACSGGPLGRSDGSAPEPELYPDRNREPAGSVEAPRSPAPVPGGAAGALCETALPLPASAAGTALLEASGPPPPLGCGAAPGAAGGYFELDLSSERAPVTLQLLFDAPAPFEVGLARGACGDLRVEQCATPLYSDQRSRLISATLAPDRYLLLIDSAATGAQVHASLTRGALSCSAAPANDECASALPLDLGAPVQSVIGTLACAHPSVTPRCAAFQAADVFYTLDLSDRAGETLLDVDVTAPQYRDVTATLFGAASEGCSEVWMCGSQFSARVAPGVYRIAVSAAAEPAAGPIHPGLPGVSAAEPSPFALRIGLGQSDCAQTRNTSWQTALDLDPSLARQLIRGNTACGRAALDAACFGDRGAPELYYRLDLRGAAGPRSLTMHSLLGADTVAYLLLAGADGVPELTSCDALLDDDAVFHLAPRLYYFVVDGRVRNAARFELELELSDERPGTRPCVDDELESCMADSEPACSDSVASPRCLESAVECGLAPSAYDAFCGGAPGCCSGAEEVLDCFQAWQSTMACR
jgi:hypothetical protein